MINQYLIALGSNLGDSSTFLIEGVKLLREEISGNLVALSPLFETDPVGGVADRIFLNAAALFHCKLEPEKFLQTLLSVESRFGRTRAVRWDNRTLDLDILLWRSHHHNCAAIESVSLSIPHPRMLERDFMLLPATVIAPHWIHPHTHNSLQQECLLREYRPLRPFINKNWQILMNLSHPLATTTESQPLQTPPSY